MPIVQIAYAGSPDAKARTRLIERTTAIVCEELAVPPQAVNVLLTKVEPQHWGAAGTPLSVTFAARAKAAGTPPPPRGARSVWTRNGGLQLHALDFAGIAPALVIVPGITSPAATWRFIVDALDLPNRIVVLDNRGRGLSDAPAQGYAREDYAADVAAWIAELGLVDPVVLGHSMGARAAAAWGATVPGGRVIAVDPPMSGPDRPYPSPLSFYLDGLASASAGGTVASFRETSPGWSDARIRDRLDWLPTCSVSAIRESHAHFHDEAFLDVWAALSGEALFVRGARSPVVLAEDMAVVAAALPAAEARAVPDAGHMIAWDNLAGFVDAIRPWILARTPGAEARP